MTRVIPENARKRMSREEIHQEYDGKWLYLIHVELNPFYAVPVVVADDWWEDRETGIYQSFRSDISNGATMHLSLLKSLEVMVGQY
jgi:hypothetical protein